MKIENIKFRYNRGSELIDAYNAIVDKLDLNKSPRELLNSMTDEELYIFIAAKTYAFGRDLFSSYRNADCHDVVNKRQEVINTFCKPDREKIFGVI